MLLLRLGVIVGFLSCIVGTICGGLPWAPEVECSDAGHPGVGRENEAGG